MKEARLGLYPAQAVIDAIKPMFLAGGRQATRLGQAGRRPQRRGRRIGVQRHTRVGGRSSPRRRPRQGEGPSRREDARQRTNGWTVPGAADPPEDTDDDGETVKTVPWPTLSDTALHGTAGKIVNLVAPHTEADPAALLVQLLAEFGATLGPEPHFVAGNDRHQAIIDPLIVGRTNNGAKGTGLAAVDAIRSRACPGSTSSPHRGCPPPRD